MNFPVLFSSKSLDFFLLSIDMLPFQRNKVDLSVSQHPAHTVTPTLEHCHCAQFFPFLSHAQNLSPQEQQLFAKYGKLPTHKSVLMKMQKVCRISL